MIWGHFQNEKVHKKLPLKWNSVSKHDNRKIYSKSFGNDEVHPRVRRRRSRNAGSYINEEPG